MFGSHSTVNISNGSQNSSGQAPYIYPIYKNDGSFERELEKVRNQVTNKRKIKKTKIKFKIMPKHLTELSVEKIKESDELERLKRERQLENESDLDFGNQTEDEQSLPDNDSDFEP